MINILSVADAQNTILKRDNAFFFADAELTAQQKEMATKIYGRPLTPDQGVRHILSDIQKRGDAAVKTWTHKLDGIENWQMVVGPEQFQAALRKIDPTLRHALETAAGRIRDFHQRQPLPNWTTTEMGGTIGQRVTAIPRVGVYVPGGTAPFLLLC